MKHRLVIILMLLAILCASAALFYKVRLSEKDRIRIDFNNQVNASINAIEDSSRQIQTQLKSWGDLQANGQAVTLEGFERLAKGSIDKNPVFDFVLWVEAVSNEQRAAVEDRIKRQFVEVVGQRTFTSDKEIERFFEHFNILELIQFSDEKALQLTVVAGEPKEDVDALLGMNFMSMRQFGLSVDFKKLLSSGQLISFPIFPSLVSSDLHPIFSLAVPIIQDASQAEQMRSDVTLKGLINVAVPSQKFFSEGGLAAFKQSNLTIEDVTEDDLGRGIKQVFYYGDREHAFSSSAIETNLRVFERDFTLRAEPGLAYIASKRSTLPFFILLTGLVFALSYLYYIWIGSQNKKRVQKLVKRKTKHLQDNNSKLSVVNQELEHLSRIDGLTGIDNRRSFDEVSEKEWLRALREQSSLVILMIDVDHFKAYNDEYGHVKGDYVLRQVAQTIKEVCSRSSDLVARYGGEEFTVILPNTGHDALRVAERCRAAVSALKVPHKRSASSDRITVSVGMSSVIPTPKGSLKTLLESADRALYLAKLQGRNRVIYHAYPNKAEEALSITESQDDLSSAEHENIISMSAEQGTGSTER